MSRKTKCPFCNKEFTDILKHYVIVHNIRDVKHFKAELEKVENKEQKKTDFRIYVHYLIGKMREGVISAEEYRELIKKWEKEHK